MWLIFCACGSPPGRAGRGRLFLQGFSAGDIFPVVGRFAVRLQLGLPHGGPSSISVRATQQRCSRPLLRPLPAAATKIKTAAAKMETSAPSSSGAPQTRRPGARQHRVRAERHLGAWEEVRASRYEPTGWPWHGKS